MVASDCTDTYHGMKMHNKTFNLAVDPDKHEITYIENERDEQARQVNFVLRPFLRAFIR